jgi:hypothetical protein
MDEFMQEEFLHSDPEGDEVEEGLDEEETEDDEDEAAGLEDEEI